MVRVSQSAARKRDPQQPTFDWFAAPTTSVHSPAREYVNNIQGHLTDYYTLA